MPNRTSIAWTDRTSNPLVAIDRATGKRGWFCTKVSAGCQNCYAEKLNKRFGNGLAFTEANKGRVEWRLNERELEAILRLREPQRIFLEDMGDLFHEDVPDEFIARVFSVMVTANRHTFQVLTKRPQRMRDLLTSEGFWATVRDVAPPAMPSISASMMASLSLRNVWLGVSVENQARADERIPLLLETPAAVRFVSCEPLLGPLDLMPWLPELRLLGGEAARVETVPNRFGSTTTGYVPGLDWVIVGGESGGPPERRLVARCGCKGLFDGVERQTCIGCHDTGWGIKREAREWVRDIRDQCHAAGVPFFFKQWGGPTPKSGGCLLESREHKEMPRQEVRA